MFRIRESAVVLFAVLYGCVSENPSNPVAGTTDPQAAIRAAAKVQGQRFLPVGTKVPEGAIVPGPIAPFDPKRDTLVPNNFGETNLVGRPGVTLPRYPAPSPTPGNGDMGLLIDNTSHAWGGMSGVMPVSLSIAIPQRTAPQGTGYLYAPTMLTPGKSCIENTLIHVRAPGAGAGDTTRHQIGWWDFCNSGNPGTFAVLLNIDNVGGFTSKYVRTFAAPIGSGVWSLVMNNNGGCWSGYLYDYSAGGWTTAATSCVHGGVTYSPWSGGWTVWESHDLESADGCSAYTNIASTGLNLYDTLTTGWTALNTVTGVGPAQYSPHYCWTNYGGGNRTFTWPYTLAADSSTWYADTDDTPPSPPSVTISGKSSVRSGATCAWTAAATGGLLPYSSYAWYVNGSSVNNNASTPDSLIYQNTGSNFTITVDVVDKHLLVGHGTKAEGSPF